MLACKTGNIGNRSRKGLRFYFRDGLIYEAIRMDVRPKNNKYRYSLDGSKPSMILSTIESGGMDIYLAATEDNKIRAKTTDQVIIIENCFIRNPQVSICC
jgi:hypothetical protein